MEQQAQGYPRRWCGTPLAVGLIVSAVVAAYCNSFNGEFIFDDQGWIIDNPSIRQLWPIGDVLFPAVAGRVGGRPVVSLTLALNYRYGGLDVRGYHAVNLAIHILAALALFGVVRRTLILPRLGARFAAAATPLATAVAVIWAVHPLQTEAVSYVVQRAESLVGLFYLLSLYGVIRGATCAERASARRVLWYLVAVGACLLGMATKEVMVTAPVVVLLYDRIFLAGSFSELFVRRGALYLGLAVTWGVVVWVLVGTQFHADSAGFQVEGFTPWSYFLTEPAVILMYLRLAAWPVPLCFDYVLKAPASAIDALPATLLVSALLAATVWALLKRPAAGFLGAAFFLILAPTSSVVPILDAAVEHRMYLPLAAVVSLAVLGGFRLWQRICGARLTANRAVYWGVPTSIVLAVVVGLGSATIARNRDYRTAFAIWNDTVEKNPGSWRAHYNLGLTLSQQGKVAEAIAEYRRTTEIDPGYADAYRNWGSELARQGKLGEAIPLLEKAIQAKPEYAESHFDLGLALARRGQGDLAIQQYREAARLKPDYADAHNNLGELLGRQGRLGDAVTELVRAVELKPDDDNSHVNLAVVLAREGLWSEAAAQFRRAIEINPRSMRAHTDFAGALSLQGKVDEAIAQYRLALAIAPDDPEAHFNLGKLLHQRGDARDAIAHWREATRLQPSNFVILNQLAWTLATDPDATLRNGAEAVSLALRAVQLSGGRNPVILATLAAAHAEAGQYPKAVETAERALELIAKQPQMAPLAATLREQIKLYEASSPFHESPRP